VCAASGVHQTSDIVQQIVLFSEQINDDDADFRVLEQFEITQSPMLIVSASMRGKLVLAK